MNFKECLKLGKLEKISYGKKAAQTERVEAVLDLETAEESLEKGNYKWAITQAYYAAFHSCRATILEQGYREKSHECLIAAWEQLRRDKTMTKTLRKLKALRNQADYGCFYSREEATEAIKDSRRILTANTGRRPCSTQNPTGTHPP
ncbi:hypothetical protein AUJ15_01440 [Candidatus Micrarchaeota archaeon CG1_02_55_41]|nr:MAG: hypothetical protein AUJ15_01440 [Candidatus Micrarchaeota archaeon CG1_02_55_41]